MDFIMGNTGNNVTVIQVANPQEEKTKHLSVLTQAPYEIIQSIGYMTANGAPAPYVTFGSTQAVGNEAFRAFDNDPVTYWTQLSSEYDASNNYTGISLISNIGGAFLVFDMSDQLSVLSIQITGRATQRPLAWSIVHSVDNVIYSTAFSTSTQTINTTPVNIVLPNLTVCRYIGIQIHKSTDGFASISNIKLTVQKLRTRIDGHLEVASLSSTSTKVAMGLYAGSMNQSQQAIAVGLNAGQSNQGLNSIAVGVLSGAVSQSGNSVAIGTHAGRTNQSTNACAIGLFAGNDGQSSTCVAIGSSSGSTSQGAAAIAIGHAAGNTRQGANCIAIGRHAGVTDQHTSSIVLNGTGANLNTTSVSSLVIKPIRPDTNTHFLKYNVVTGEVTYSL